MEHDKKMLLFIIQFIQLSSPFNDQRLTYTANVNRQTTDKLLFSHAIITDENM